MSSHDNRSHVLATLGALFILGSTARLIPTGVANAEEPAPPETPPAEPSAPASNPLLAEASAPQSAETARNISQQSDACLTGTLGELMNEDRWLFEEKEAAYTERLLSLDLREQQLSDLERDLVALKATLDDRWQEMQKTAMEDRSHLAAMYTAMKPGEAATIFNQMSPGLASEFLREIPSEQSGLILANMDEQKAYAVSLELASRNRDVLDAS